MIIFVIILFPIVFPICLYREFKKQKQARADQLQAMQEELQAAENERIKNDNTIVFYEIQIEQLQELSRLYQSELDRTTDSKKRRTLLAKCISLDKQVFAAQQKRDKLERDV